MKSFLPEQNQPAPVIAIALSVWLCFAPSMDANAFDDVRSGPPSGSMYVVPRIVGDGLEKYQFSGAAVAVSVWLQFAGPRVQERGAGYIEALRVAEGVYGKFIGYHVVSIRKLTPATDIVYLVLNYERGPLFARFEVYEHKNTDYVTEFSTGFSPTTVFPEKLLY